MLEEKCLQVRRALLTDFEAHRRAVAAGLELALQGPKALEILAPFASAGVSALRYYGFLQGEVAGAPALISRM